MEANNKNIKNRRTVFKVIKNPNATTNKNSRLAIVEFHDNKGTLTLDVPELPRGTVIEIDPSSCNLAPEDNWEVVDFQSYGKSNSFCDAKLDNIKDLAQFYKATKDLIPAKDFRVICENYPGNTSLFFRENPYFMFSPSFFSDSIIRSFSFKPFDIAKSFVTKTFEDRRQEIASFINYELLMNESSGNTGIPFGLLKEKVMENLSLIGRGLSSEEELFFDAFINYSNSFLFTDLSEKRVCRFYMDINDFSDNTLVFQKTTFDMENRIYERIKEWYSSRSSVYTNCIYSDFLSDEQNDAVNAVFFENVNLNIPARNISIITGGPGTGKTTVIKEIIRRATEDTMAKVKVLAPTGRAAQRVQETIGDQFLASVKVSTIHKHVGFGTKDEFQLSENITETEDKDYNLIIIDEGSMLPLNVFRMLLDKLEPNKTKLLLIGDADQLPSVDAGNILVDLINLGVPTSYLTQNFRSDDYIVKFSKKINKREIDQDILKEIHSLDEVNSGGIYLFNTKNIMDTKVESIISDYAVMLNGPVVEDEDYIIRENNENYTWSFLSARLNGEILTTKSLNYKIAKKLRESRGFSEAEISADFAYGDRVIACETKYSDSENNSYYNGDIGILQKGIFYDNEIQYPIVFTNTGSNIEKYVNRSDLALAYDLTIHKSQGSEYDIVGLVLIKNDNFLSKKLLYTAVTRAKYIIVIFGTYSDLEKALNNDNDETRTTLLSVMPKMFEIN